MHLKFLRLLLDLQEIQVKHLELSFPLLFVKHFPRVLPVFNYTLPSPRELFLALCYPDPTLRAPAGRSLRAAHVLPFYCHLFNFHWKQ